MNVAIIGVAGNMARNHIRCCKEIFDLKIVGVCDTNKFLGFELAQQYNTKFYENYQDLLSTKPDFVSIVTPTSLHYEMTKFFIENNVNVLLEKPVTRTIEEVDMLIELNKQHNVKVMVGHIERFNPTIIKLKEILDNNSIGDIISFTINRVGFYPPQIKDVGILLDIGYHDFDLSHYLFGNIHSIYSTTKTNFGKHEDCAISVLKFYNGVQGVLEESWCTPYKLRTIKVMGTKGVVSIDLVKMEVLIDTKEWKQEAIIDKKEPLRLEIEHMMDCITNNKDPLINLSKARKTLYITLNALKSATHNEIINM